MRIKLLFYALFLTASLSFESACGQGNAPSSLPEGWRDLPVSELVPLVQSLVKQGVLSPAERLEVSQHAAGLLTSADFSSGPTSTLPVLQGLQELGWKQTDRETRERIRSEILRRNDDWTGTPYDQIRAKVMMLIQVKQPLAAYGEARKWVDSGGTLEVAKQSPQATEDLKHPLAPVALEVLFQGGEPIYGSLKVTWEGSLVAPQSGDYILSVCPVNINAEHSIYRVKETMTVSLDGQTVISATPQNWAYRSNPVALIEGQRTPIRVSVDIESAPTRYHHGIIHAMLFWERSDLPREIVPPSAFRLPTDGNSSGLSATYEWRDPLHQARTLTQVDSSIDYLWPKNGAAVIANRVGEGPALRLLVKSRWRETVTSSVLDQLEESGKIHELIQVADDIGGTLSTEQRNEFVGILLSRPQLLSSVPPNMFWKFFRVFHMSNPDNGVPLFGEWSRLHADAMISMPTGPPAQRVSSEIRSVCRDMSVCFFHEVPGLFQSLQSNHLTLPDGSCVLPVAYTLGYGYQSMGRIREWQDYLDTKLADDSLAGDRRVNWLLARAHATEVAFGSPQPYAAIDEDLLAGRTWLEQAIEVAQTASFQSRVRIELAARLTANGKYPEARDLLGSIEGPEVVSARQAIDASEQASIQSMQGEREASLAGYQKVIQRRQEQSGDPVVP